ncbi:helix-turn-helix domain-containing protein [Kocuria tytonis]|uniref:Helix-turn-helix domain-containing protein n=1 Tax=Kocuria tytonis TaxID=2054280 RepID=A0A495A8Z0_9MICC|nr:helix-turn-helix domain-containing protein [Kocuria tytonis]RKQ36233.1 helix-turn-helix domain-containing protein [Kocuria tytonis]
MSVQATTWVWEHSQAEGSTRLVLLAIADAANREGARSFQSAETLASMCKMSSRTVRRQIKILQDLGEIEVEGRAGSHGTNSYRIVGVPSGHPIGHSNVLGQSVRGDTGGQSIGHLGHADRTSGVASSDTAMSTNPIPHGDPSTTPGSAPVGAAPAEEVEPVQDQHPAHLIAQRAYDATHGALKFMAVRSVAQWAIDKRGETPGRVEQGIAEIHHRGKPVTRAVLDQWFDGALDRKQPWQMDNNERMAAAYRQGTRQTEQDRHLALAAQGWAGEDEQ